MVRAPERVESEARSDAYTLASLDSQHYHGLFKALLRVFPFSGWILAKNGEFSGWIFVLPWILAKNGYYNVS